MNERNSVRVIGYPIDILSWDAAVSRILLWAKRRESRIVCICNTHSIVTAGDDASFGSILNASDMNTADGAPVAWFMRLRGATEQERINGPDLMWRCCEKLNRPDSSSIFLYGSTVETNLKLISVLNKEFPYLRIAGYISPPFRSLTEAETLNDVQTINSSGAGLVWVSLGCPKQERWMASNREKVRAVMIGVGAAFEYHSLVIKRAPLWMQRSGLEWLHRLASEPRRLWRRYFYNNSMFLFRAIFELIRGQK